MNRVVVVGLAFTCFGLADRGSAQSIDRSKRPVVDAPVPFAFPEMKTQRLPNGLLIVVIENHSLPLVAVRAVVNADSLNDPIGKEGLSALTSSMLAEGTTTRSAEHITSEIATLGNAVTPFRFTTIPENLGASLELMADMLARPTFPDSALARLEVTLAAAKERDLQSPATIPNRVFLARVYGSEHPIARAVAATAASINSITRDDLVRFHSTYFLPNSTTVVVVGDVRAADVFVLAAKTLGSWRSRELSPLEIPSHTLAPTTIYLVDRPAAHKDAIATER